MITADKIKSLVITYSNGSDLYPVEVKVSGDNKITVYIDNGTKISIADCAQVSKFIEEHLNRDEADFELTVSSPGVDEPFKHVAQYKKRIGCQVAVVTKEGKKIIGKLLEVFEDGIVVALKSKEKVDQKKSRQVVIEQMRLGFAEIKETKLVLSF